MDKNLFMFSVDLEDVRLGVENGMKYKSGVVGNTHLYLSWLDRHGFKSTFFVTGNVAESYPALISDIISRGHEVACHTTNHLPLNAYTPEDFRIDLKKNIDLLKAAGADEVTGFRAPSYSLTPDTRWVYEILSEAGIRFSSSVLPGLNPISGWPGFGETPCLMDNGIIELPLTIVNAGLTRLAFAGGIYFRVLPFWFILYNMKKRRKLGEPVIGYFHPYDVDTNQERFMHGGIGNNKLYNFLMYLNRNKVISRLEKIVNTGFRVIPYSELAAELRARNELRIFKA